MRDTTLIGAQRLATWDGGAAAPGRAARMAAVCLTVTDFRCYRFLRLEAEARPVVLTGPNGAGKTNLLEALSFLVPGRGLRRARLDEVTRRTAAPEGPAGWAVAARLAGPGGETEIGTGLEPAAERPADGAPRRIVRIDGETVKAQAALAEHLSVVWLTPQMDRLFQDGASARRRFLDRLVFGFDPAHAGRLAAYEHALRERARLLKGEAEGRRADPAWLAVLEQTMAEKGVAVAAARREVVERLDRACAEAEGPFPRARLALEGEIDGWLRQGPALAAEDRLRERLAAARRRDAEDAAAAGPHRSDLAVRHAGTDMPAELCSTGEQKALLVAVVLADARLQAAERGSTPLLLLDEVVAHLDGARRQALFEALAGLGAQSWLTGTDEMLFAGFRRHAQFFRVHDGAAAPA